MKKHYNTPSIEVIAIENCNTLCTSKLTVGGDDSTGTEQLSKEFLGGCIFEEEESISETGTEF